MSSPEQSLGKVRDVITSDHYGKVVVTRSDRFGYGMYLVVDHPGEYFADRCRFVKLPSGMVLYYSSMEHDDVLRITTLLQTFHHGDDA